MTLRDVVGWLVGGFRKKGAVRLGLFLLGPPAQGTIINPLRVCAARVTVLGLCVCVCVHSNLPPHTLESQKRGTNGFIAIRET